MSTNTQQNVQVQNVTPSSITDLLMNNIVLSKMTNVLDKNFKLSFENIIKIFILMSINELKDSTNSLLKYLLSKIKLFPSLAFSLATSSIQILKSYNKEKLNNILFNDVIDKSYKDTVLIDIELNFIECLYNYILKNNNTKFKKSLRYVKIKNIKENIFEENIDNIIINFDSDITIRIINGIRFDIEQSTNSFSDFWISNSPKSYSDLLSANLKKALDMLYNRLIREFGTFDKIIDTIRIDESYLSEFPIAKQMCEKYGFNLKRTIVELSLVTVCVYIYNNNDDILKNLFEFLKKYDKNKDNIIVNKIIYDVGPEYVFHNNYIRGRSLMCSDTIFYNLIRKFIVEFGDDYIKAYSEIGNTVDVRLQKKEITLVIESPNVFNTQKIIGDFIKNVTSLNKKKTTDNIDIYSISIKKTISKNSIDNPEYQDWYENMQIMRGGIDKKEKDTNDTKDNKDTKDNNDNFDFQQMSFMGQFMHQMPQMMQIPPKKLITESVTKEIVSTKLNSKEKKIDTMYFRENDKNKLLTSLFQFKEKKELLQSLGFQNKLNILLYGEPGTGKSSTIEAIATYLQKDIYYVDLKEAQINKDFQLIFDYVNKNVKSGGIIVMEDIDAMTNIVLKRTENKEIKQISKISENDLSLDYLLNILQGTLTVDDSIIIVTTNHIDHLDPAFYRDGRFDVKMKLQLCDHYQIREIYKRILGRNISEDILLKIPEDKYSPATIIYHVKDFIFNNDTTDDEIMLKFFNN